MSTQQLLTITQKNIAATHIDDGFTDRLGNVVTQQNGTKELGHGRQYDCLPQRHSLGSNGGGECVGHIVRSDTKRGEKCSKSSNDDDPKKVVRRLRDQNALLRNTHGALPKFKHVFIRVLARLQDKTLYVGPFRIRVTYCF